MPERIAKLQAILKELEAELASLDEVDTESQQVLEDALEELRQALGKTNAQTLDAQSLASEPLIERFRTAEGNFQVSHPTLSGLVLRMINALGQFGI